MTLYEEYVTEYPEELTGVNHLKAYSRRVETCIERRRQERLTELQKYKEQYYGDDHS